MEAVRLVAAAHGPGTPGDHSGATRPTMLSGASCAHKRIADRNALNADEYVPRKGYVSPFRAWSDQIGAAGVAGAR